MAAARGAGLVILSSRIRRPEPGRLDERPAARSMAPNGYRGEVARKSRNRGGAPRARTAAAARPAGGAPAGTAQLTAQAGTGHSPAAKTSAYPGEGLGLPERGPGSMASMGRRLLALVIDWLLCTVIAYWLTHSQFWTIAVFAVEDYVLTALTGCTVGKRLLGIRVVRTNGGLVGLRWALVRTAILLTVVPPLLTDRDLRGLHDRASDTMVIRL
jgi:hypothetical protein